MPNALDVNRWRRMGWPRIILYIVCFMFIIHLFNSFLQQPQKPMTATSLLPWYKNPHPTLTFLQKNDHIKTDLTSDEREKLQMKMVAKARNLASNAFRSVNGIPGSIHDTAEKAKEFRSLVDCWTTGEWVKVEEPSYIMPHFQDPLYGSCERKFRRKNPNNELRPAVKYVWQSQCDPKIDIDTVNWCSVLNGRDFLVVGDLVQYQLHEIILDTLRDGPAICFGELNCKDHTLCAEPEVRLRYLRNDILSTRRKMYYNHGSPTADVIEWPFVSSALMKGYSIVILNRAPVLESDDKFIDTLLETIQAIRKLSPNTLIIYRSTGIGHPFCDDAEEPLSERLTDDQMKELPFGWSEVNRRNAIAREIIESAGGLFVDLGALTDLRPDGHIGGQDCLRYCIPGPLTSWAQILYQVFLGLEGQLPVNYI